MDDSAIDASYDPSTESTNDEQIAASKWELLRRNEKFQIVAKRWKASRKFREAHVLTAEYTDSDLPRCALDWMLIPEQRLELAKFQVSKLRWKRMPHPNYGPIVYKEKSLSRLSAANATEMVDIMAMQRRCEPVTVSTTWRDSPEPFQRQVRHAVLSPEVSFESLNEYVENLANHVRWMAKKLAAGDPLHEMQMMGESLFEIGNELHDFAALSHLYRISRKSYPGKVFKHILKQITEDFSETPLEIIDGRKFDRHRSYQGTAEDWRWFLESERLGLDVCKSADCYKLAEIYSQDLRQRQMRGKAHSHAKAQGFTGTKFSSRDIKNRRSIVKRHVHAIGKWILDAYPPSVEPDETIS